MYIFNQNRHCVCPLTTHCKLHSDVWIRDLHGNGDDGNTVVTAVMETTAAVMGTVFAVIPQEWLLLKRYYCGSGHRIL